MKVIVFVIVRSVGDELVSITDNWPNVIETTINQWSTSYKDSDLETKLTLCDIEGKEGCSILAGSGLVNLLTNPLVNEFHFLNGVKIPHIPGSRTWHVNRSIFGSDLDKIVEMITKNVPSYVIPIEREEKQYLDVLRTTALSKSKPSRAGPVRSTTLETMRFSLTRFSARVLPMLTTKSMSVNSVWEELKMFILGETTTKRLTDKKIPIWDINTSRAHLDAVGLQDYPEGTLGPVYGFQWRHFGGDWQNIKENPGVDQLANVIANIKSDPYSRRHVVSAWNPVDIKKMALPPCHTLFEFIVNADGKLDCVFFMRSADLALGVPYNLVSYALLTHLVSIETGLEPGELIPVLADCHVYDSHLKGISHQLRRTPQAFPCMEFAGLENYKTIDDVDNLKIKVINYSPDSFIKLTMEN